MFARTNIEEAPWFIVKGNDKKRARLNCIRHLLEQVPYEPVETEDIELPDRVFNPKYERRVLPRSLYVPEHYEGWAPTGTDSAISPGARCVRRYSDADRDDAVGCSAVLEMRRLDRPDLVCRTPARPSTLARTSCLTGVDP